MNLRRLPKVELHRHLEGSVRFETFLEIAREAKIDLPTRDKRKLRGLLCVGKSDARTLPSFLSKFNLLRRLYPSRDCIERVAREAVEDAAADGVVYLELRFSPVHFARRMGVDPSRCAEWIIAAARKAAPIQINFIVTLGRDFPADVNAPSIGPALAHPKDIVGVDVAGDESHPITPLVPLLRRARKAGLSLTIHAGESCGPESVREALRLGASRIGHGVRAAEDPKLEKELLARRIGIESCLTSNLHTGAVPDLRRHPLKRWLREGQLVTLSTDDPAISRIDLVDEYKKAGLTIEELQQLNRNAVEVAFLPPAAKKRLLATFSAAPGPARRR